MTSLLPSDVRLVMSNALLDAATAQDPQRVQALLRSGSSPVVVHPLTGHTALYVACFTDRHDIVRLLLDHGADPNQAITYRSPVDGRVDAGLVALMLARSTAVATALLEGGADPNARDAEGRTPLMRVAFAASSEVVERLLAASADPSVRSNSGHTVADVVENRLRWLRRHRAELRRPHADHRIATLERVLTLVSTWGGARE